MTDEELLIWLRVEDTNLTDLAAARIEALTKERDQHWDSFVHWRKEADDLSEQLAAARRDVEIAEEELELQEEEACMMENSYFELEKELNTCRNWNQAFNTNAALLERAERLEAALHNCVGMLDQLVAESGRAIEWDAEDPFRMGEWFEPEDLAQIEQARAALKGADHE